MKAIYETCRGEFQTDEISTLEEGLRLVEGSEIWRIEDEDGTILASSR